MTKRNPNGYGSITKLKGNRLRPFMIRVTVYDANGCGRQKAIGYADSMKNAAILLAGYNNHPFSINREHITFNELYVKWLELKSGSLGKSNLKLMKTAFNWCSPCYGLKYYTIKAYHMQRCIDNCPLSRSTKASIHNLFSHLDKFAYEIDLIDKMYSQLLIINSEATESTRSPFTKEQINTLWAYKDEPGVDSVLVFIYTGLRLNELLSLRSEQINIAEKYIQGGLKTSAGKNRIIPIHPKILPFIRKWLSGKTEYLLTTSKGTRYSPTHYYRSWNRIMKMIETDKTPHEARHTFETLLDNAGGNRKCIDLLMGHSSRDIGNRVYNHKTIEQLWETILLLNDIDVKHI